MQTGLINISWSDTTYLEELKLLLYTFFELSQLFQFGAIISHSLRVLLATPSRIPPVENRFFIYRLYKPMSRKHRNGWGSPNDR